MLHRVYAVKMTIRTILQHTFLTGLLTNASSAWAPGMVLANTPGGLLPITFASWQEKLADNRGAITVVDFWVTWCALCLKRFPHMKELHARYEDKGVRFISVSLDDREDKEAIKEAEVFLAEQKILFETYLMDENVTDAFEKPDLMSLPAVLIYDRQGSLQRKLTGDDPNSQFTHEDLDSAVAEAVNSSCRTITAWKGREWIPHTFPTPIHKP
jgi:thiol-disulfide isomerase/thioredoxin